MATIKETIKKLTAERDVTAEQLAKCFQEIMTAEASPAQVGAFLVLLKYIIFYSVLSSFLTEFSRPFSVLPEEIIT
jgi:hypothetical protein